jgi:hypothetical protein
VKVRPCPWSAAAGRCSWWQARQIPAQVATPFAALGEQRGNAEQTVPSARLPPPGDIRLILLIGALVVLAAIMETGLAHGIGLRA